MKNKYYCSFVAGNYFYKEYIVRHLEQKELDSIKKHCANLQNQLNLSVEKLNRMLDQHWLFLEDVTRYIDSHNVRNKQYCEAINCDNDYDRELGHRLEEVRKTPSLSCSFDYIFEISIKYGIYATDVLSFRQREYPTDIADIPKMELPSFSHLAERGQGGIQVFSFSPDDFSYLWEETSSAASKYGDDIPLKIKQNVARNYAFFIDIHNKDFDIEQALDEVKRRMVIYRISYKIQKKQKISEPEWEMYCNSYPTIRKSRYRADIIARIIGLRAWDIISKDSQKNQTSVFKESFLPSQIIYCHSELCKGSYQDPGSGSFCGEHCPNMESCFRQISRYYTTAKACIENGKILPTAKKVTNSLLSG